MVSLLQLFIVIALVHCCSGYATFDMTTAPDEGNGIEKLNVRCFFTECKPTNFLKTYDGRKNELCDVGYDYVGDFQEGSELDDKAHKPAKPKFLKNCTSGAKSTLCCHDMAKLWPATTPEPTSPPSVDDSVTTAECNGPDCTAENSSVWKAAGLQFWSITLYAMYYRDQ